MRLRSWGLVLVGCLFAANAQSQSPREDVAFFESKIRPVLAEHCFKCHSEKKMKGELRLDSRSALLKGGETGPAITPGDPAKSLLMKAVGYGDPDLRMPPRGRLPDAVIDDLAAWIQRGAAWPDDAVAKKAASLKEFDLKERSKFWSLQPLATRAVPKVKNPAWVRSPIDAFVLAKLEEKGLAPATSADPRALLRRVTFDLIGLPPTPQEIDMFLKDCDATDRQAAFEKVVDRLLASPRYGERWGRHWLDLVRYAETQGHEFDFEMPEAHKYRDHVIRAFNDDVPYHQMVVEHLAGDLLPKPRWHTKEHVNESLLATGFWWLGEAKHSPVDSRSEQAERIDNQIDVFGKAFLGMTIACARCHDHKFDAITAKDYYALAGFLQSSRQDHAFLDDPQERGKFLDSLRVTRRKIEAELPKSSITAPTYSDKGTRFARFDKGWNGWRTTGEAFGDRPSQAGDLLLPPGKAPQPVAPGLAHSGLLAHKLQGALRSPNFTIQHKRIHYRLAGSAVRVNLILNGLQILRDPIYGSLTFSVNNEAMHWRTQDVSMWVGQRAYLEMHDDGDGWGAIEQVVFSDDPSPPPLPAPKPAAPYAADVLAKVQPLLAEYHKAEAAVPAPRRAMGIADGSAINEHLFIRGSHKNLGEPVPRRFLTVFGGQPIDTEGSGRLELARQMTDSARTPLLPRVMVNRLWKHHFGEGIVRSTDDFGLLGQAPSHPELLDWLASEFIRQGWSLKKMHKLLVLSSTYQMASRASAEADEADPTNQLLHRMPVRRLEAEAIRDALLAVSGRLDTTMHGPGVLPHLSAFMVGRGRPGASGPLDGNGRRSVYLNVRRNFLNPMFLAFDYPTPFTAIGRRSVSNVPAQALTMMNNPLVLQQAELWAKRVLAEPNRTPEQRVEAMTVAALGRPPSELERRELLAFLAEQGKLHGRADDPRAWTDLAHVMFNLKEFIFVP